VTLDAPTDLEQVIFDQAARLLERCPGPRPEPVEGLVEGKAWDRCRKVRLIGVGVSKFEPLEERQLSLFEGAGEGKVEKLRRLSQAVDRIREKYGDESIRRASLATTLPHHDEDKEFQ
jgi:hypothetical protein